MLTTPGEIVTDVNDVHTEKTSSPMVPAGRVTDFNLAHPEKALVPIV
jgi:hypothetical protein